MNELKSYTEYAVSTPTADFVIGFDFNYGEDAVNVTVDDVPATEAGYTVVYLNETTIRLSPSVPSGVVRLQRETDIDQTDHAYRAGAKFIAQTMDENFEQLRHSQQEVRDGFVKLADDTYEIIDTLEEVGKSAQDAADAAEVAAALANNAAAQVNDKVSYEDFNNKPHNAMLARDAASAHPTSSILDASGETQQQVNYNGGSKWHSRVGGYLENERVVLTNGDIVKSTIDGNVNDPNSDMTGWINENGNFVDASIFGIKSSRTEDQTDKFKKAIQFAAKLGYMGLEVPSGFFVVSDTLFLVERDSSGNPLRSNYGVPLVGNGVYNTVFLFKPNAPEHVLFDTYGVSAVDSNKLVRGITVRPYVEPSLNPFNHRDIVKSSYFHQGIGLNVRETCNSPYDDLDIKGLKVGIQLTCGNGEPISYTGHDATDASRGWCEFNKFNKINLWLNKVQIRFWGGGSYHGNSFRNCKIQGVEKSVWQVIGVSSAICYGIQAIGAINTDRTNDTYWNTANLYNCYFDVNLFGNHDVNYKFIAIQMDNARTFCNTGGRITHEGDVYFEAKGNGWWTFDGDINGYNDKLLTSESLNNVTPFGNFAFRNWSSNLIGDGMQSIRPVINSGGNSNIFRLAEEPDNSYDNPFPRAANSSAFPDIFRVNGSNIDSLAFTVLDFNQYNNFWFGVNSINNKPKDFKPTFKFNAYGTNHTVYSAGSSYAFNIYSEDGVTQKTGYRVESNALTPASASHSMSLGTSSVPFSGLFTTQWTVNGGVCVPKLTATNSIGSSSLTIKDIFLQNAPTVVSDERYKSNIDRIDDAILDAWGGLDFSMWQLNAAILEKGENKARWHFGLVAQQVRDALINHGLDWTKYGLITHESWDAVEGQEAVYDDENNLISEAIEPREAGEIYMLRMDECFAVEAAYQRRRLERIESVINELTS